MSTASQAEQKDLHGTRSQAMNLERRNTHPRSGQGFSEWGSLPSRLPFNVDHVFAKPGLENRLLASSRGLVRSTGLGVGTWEGLGLSGLRPGSRGAPPCSGQRVGRRLPGSAAAFRPRAEAVCLEAPRAMVSRRPCSPYPALRGPFLEPCPSSSALMCWASETHLPAWQWHQGTVSGLQWGNREALRLRKGQSFSVSIPKLVSQPRCFSSHWGVPHSHSAFT